MDFGETLPVVCAKEAEKLGVDTRLIVLAAARCVDAVRDMMTDPRSTAAIDLALRYGAGEGIPVRSSEIVRAAATSAAMVAWMEAEEVEDASWAASWLGYAVRAAAKGADGAALPAATEITSPLEMGDNVVVSAVAAVKWAEGALQSQQKIEDICRDVLGDEMLKKIMGYQCRNDD